MYLNCEKFEFALADCQLIRQLDPRSVYIKGHYLRGLTLLKLKKYKNAAAAFQTVVKLNPSFKKATDRLNECFAELEKENVIVEKRRSSQQQILKEQFQSAQAVKDDETKEKSEEHVVEKKKESVQVDNESDGVKVDLIEENGDKNKENEKTSIFEKESDDKTTEEVEVEKVDVKSEQVDGKLDASAAEFTMPQQEAANP